MTGRASLVVLVAAVSACGLSPLDLRGLRCDEDLDCGEALRCLDGVCATPRDAGATDAGHVDAGVDAGQPDAGLDAGVDAGPPDAGAPDAGIPDAGEPDAGAPDAGVPDAGVPDAGLPFGVNFVANPGFEVPDTMGITGWTFKNASGQLVTTPVHGGQRSLYVLPVTATSASYLSTTVLTQMEAGLQLCGSVWIRGETGSTVKVQLSVRDVGADVSLVTDAKTVNGNWQRLFAVQATRAGSDLQLRLTATDGIDDVHGFYVDDVSLVRTTGACP